MKLTAEQLAAIERCSSAQEIVAKAKETGFDISLETAEQLFNNADLRTADLDDVSGGANVGMLDGNGNFISGEDLSLDDLDAVAGGNCGPCQTCANCGSSDIDYERTLNESTLNYTYDYVCHACNSTWVAWSNKANRAI